MKPQSIFGVLDSMRAGMGFNQVAHRLNASLDDTNKITSKLHEMGQTRLIPLTNRYKDARVALAFYSGDGIVTKIVPSDFYDQQDTIYSLPPITSERIRGNNWDYIVDTYPFVAKGKIKSEEVEDMRSRMQDVGLTFNNPWGEARNIHRMPDQNQTLIGIDSGMFIDAGNRNHISLELKESWKSYISTVFPIYENGIVSPQSADTNFEFISLHAPNTDIVGFDHTKDNPIIRESDIEPPRKLREGFVESLLSSFSSGPR
tara:strand:+ start:5027 stop:5803 length:777 start_codon:yes stop_codon:yes gene_type:complete